MFDTIARVDATWAWTFDLRIKRPWHRPQSYLASSKQTVSTLKISSVTGEIKDGQQKHSRDDTQTHTYTHRHTRQLAVSWSGRAEGTGAKWAINPSRSVTRSRCQSDNMVASCFTRDNKPLLFATPRYPWQPRCRYSPRQATTRSIGCHVNRSSETFPTSAVPTG